MLLVDTKRPRSTVPALVARSNNSRVIEAQVSGATLETTFTFILPNIVSLNHDTCFANSIHF
jgi:hypothetical protein